MKEYSNSLWHGYWKSLSDNLLSKRKWIIYYMDDASGFITGYGTFNNPTSRNAIKVLKKAIEKSGKPAAILTNHGHQSISNQLNAKNNAIEFEQELAKLDIKYIATKANHLLTNRKLKYFYKLIQKNQKQFTRMYNIIRWYNNSRPHRSLDSDNAETPYKAFIGKMPKHNTKVTGDTGETYYIKQKGNGSKILHSVLTGLNIYRIAKIVSEHLDIFIMIEH